MLNIGLDLCGSEIKATVLTPTSQLNYHQVDEEQNRVGGVILNDHYLLYKEIYMDKQTPTDISYFRNIGEVLDLFVFKVLKRQNERKKIKKIVHGDSNTSKNQDNLESVSTYVNSLISPIYYYLSELFNFKVNIHVITPHYFTEAVKSAIFSKSIKINQIQVHSVDEDLSLLLPYLYYGNICRKDSLVFLYNFGQFRFSYSIIRILNGKVSFVHRHCIHSISGRSISRLLFKYLTIEYMALTGSSLFDDIKDMEKLNKECAMACHSLSISASHKIRLEKLGGKTSIVISRREFEALLQLPVLTIKKTIEKSFRTIHKQVDSIDYVVTTGEVTPMPCIQKMMKSLFSNALFDCGTVVKYNASIGGSIYGNHMSHQMIRSKYCYCIRTNMDHFSVVGQSLQCLTRDIMVVPVPFSDLGVRSVRIRSVRILVERCLEKDLTKALYMPYQEAKQCGLWESVHSYDYNVTSSSHKLEETNTHTVGLDNEFTPFLEGTLPQLEQECVKIDSHLLEGDRLVLTINQVYRGQAVFGSQVRFTYVDGTILEDSERQIDSVPMHHIFSRRTNAALPALTSTSSVMPSSIIPPILTDRTQSVILEIPSEVNEDSVYIRCPNSHLRVRNLPQFINIHKPALSSSEKKMYSNLENNSLIEKKHLPQFCKQAFNENRNNELMFFKGPTDVDSPVSACCYQGSFVNGKRYGKGTEYSISHSPVYSGQWENGIYHGEGTLWSQDGNSMEGVFTNGYLNNTCTMHYKNGELAYKGEVLMSKKHGKGQEFEPDGKIYEGSFRNGLRQGEGTVRMKDIVIYEGSWEDNYKHGKGRELFNQSVYEGEYRFGLKHGRGKLSRFDGQTVYDGEWMYDKRHGKGVSFSKGGNSYEGEFNNDMYEGKGRQYHDGKLIYDGSFVENERDGSGKLYRHTPEGEQMLWMDGYFKNGKLNGMCTIYDEKGNLVYTGNTIDNVFNGKGTHYLPSGIVIEGEFFNGKLHGKGRLMSKDTLLYSGDWLYGKQNGYGEQHDDRGLYIGMFENGEKEGKGEYTMYTGEVYTGEFKNGYFNGFGRITNADGRVIYEGEWRDGQRNGMGHAYFANGEYYYGSFLTNMMSGKGTMYYSSGRLKFTGEFRKDKRNGEGILYDEAGDIVEKAYYINDIPLLYLVC